MVQKFEYKRATMEDIDELVRTRIIVLRAANKLSDDEDMSVVEEESKAYYRRALETGEHIAYLVYDNGAFVGAGGVSFYQVMPTYHNPTGKKAYIMNMYTAPEYRRQGIAFHTLDLLINDAKKQGVLQIALEATDMGRPLYERYGFVKMEDKCDSFFDMLSVNARLFEVVRYKHEYSTIVFHDGYIQFLAKALKGVCEELNIDRE